MKKHNCWITEEKTDSIPYPGAQYSITISLTIHNKSVPGFKSGIHCALKEYYFKCTREAVIKGIRR